MQCPKCSAEVSENQRYCEECGVQIQGPVPASIDAPVCHCAPELAAPDVNGLCEVCRLKVNIANEYTGALKFDYATDLGLVSDRGRHHPVNQDSGIVGRSPTGAVLMVVADGVSSSEKADIASSTAVAAAYKEMLEATDEDSASDIVLRAVAVAHAAVMAIPHTSMRLEEPESTIVLAYVRGAAATIAWVGDSRAYTISSTCSRLITRDDSWLADEVERGSMTLDQALADSRSHSITQCLGMLDDQIRIHIRNIVLEPDTWLLICTDGLWNYFDQVPAMAQAVKDAAPDVDAFELAQHLVKLANQAGGHDNITVATYRSAAQSSDAEEIKP